MPHDSRSSELLVLYDRTAAFVWRCRGGGML